MDTTERLHFHFSLSCIGEGNGNPLQCCCLENPRDWGAWWASFYGVTQSWTRLKRLSSSSSSSSILFIIHDKSVKGSPSGSEYACNVGDAWDTGLVPWRRKMESHSSILAWEIPSTEDPVWLQSWGCKELDKTEQLNTYIQRCHIFSHIKIIGWTY